MATASLDHGTGVESEAANRARLEAISSRLHDPANGFANSKDVYSMACGIWSVRHNATLMPMAREKVLAALGSNARPGLLRGEASPVNGAPDGQHADERAARATAQPAATAARVDELARVYLDYTSANDACNAYRQAAQMFSAVAARLILEGYLFLPQLRESLEMAWMAFRKVAEMEEQKDIAAMRLLQEGAMPSGRRSPAEIGMIAKHCAALRIREMELSDDITRIKRVPPDHLVSYVV